MPFGNLSDEEERGNPLLSVNEVVRGFVVLGLRNAQDADVVVCGNLVLKCLVEVAEQLGHLLFFPCVWPLVQRDAEGCCCDCGWSNYFFEHDKSLFIEVKLGEVAGASIKNLRLLLREKPFHGVKIASAHPG